MGDRYAVSVDNVSKSFRLPHERHNGLKQFLINILRKPSRKRNGSETQHVLKDISFTIKKGEFFGIVGRNGSGKSTLLKLLAGIYIPESGRMAVNGSLAPFIELGVGFNPELTGRENVYLNGALLGFGHGEMDTMYDDIVSFAELDKFMDQKLKNYSSGMQVRLAFSIAIRAKADILLIDEVLAVGDTAFQKKCTDYFQLAKEQKKTIILVTHDMSAVERFCDRALFIKDGEVQQIGDPYIIASAYDKANQELQVRTPQSSVLDSIGQRAKIEKAEILTSRDDIEGKRSLCVGVDFEVYSHDDVIIGVSIVRRDNVYIAGQNTKLEKMTIRHGAHHITHTLDLKQLLKGSYFINISLYTRDFSLLDFAANIGQFSLKEHAALNKDGIIDMPGEWKYDSSEKA